MVLLNCIVLYWQVFLLFYYYDSIIIIMFSQLYKQR